MKTNETPTQEQSILSIEDRAKAFYPFKTADLICSPKLVRDGFIAGVNEMLPIIKELGEALKEIQEANTGGVINTHWMQNHIQTVLNKYQNFL